VRKIPYYRKHVIAKLKELTYLDDKPVFEDERRYCDAFQRGGIEEERKERTKYKQEKIDADNQRLQDFRDLVETWKKDKPEKTPTEEEKEEENKKLEEKQKMMDKCLKLKKDKDKSKKLVIHEEDGDEREVEINTKVNCPKADKTQSNEKTITKNPEDEFFDKNANPVIKEIIKEEGEKSEKRPFVKDNNIFDHDEVDDLHMPDLEHVSKDGKTNTPVDVEELIRSVEREQEQEPEQHQVRTETSQEVHFTEKINSFSSHPNHIKEEIVNEEKKEKMKEAEQRSKSFFDEVD